METYYLACAYVLAGVLGLCVGSFLNVLIYRLPRGMNIAKPPSHCPACGYRLKWYDNIPVLSYCILRGGAAIAAGISPSAIPRSNFSTADCGWPAWRRSGGMA